MSPGHASFHSHLVQQPSSHLLCQASYCSLFWKLTKIAAPAAALGLALTCRSLTCLFIFCCIITLVETEGAAAVATKVTFRHSKINRALITLWFCPNLAPLIVSKNTIQLDSFHSDWEQRHNRIAVSQLWKIVSLAADSWKLIFILELILQGEDENPLTWQSWAFIDKKIHWIVPRNQLMMPSELIVRQQRIRLTLAQNKIRGEGERATIQLWFIFALSLATFL